MSRPQAKYSLCGLGLVVLSIAVALITFYATSHVDLPWEESWQAVYLTVIAVTCIVLMVVLYVGWKNEPGRGDT